MECEESLVQFVAFLLKHSHSDFDASLTQFSDSVAMHFGKGVHTAHYRPLHPLPDNEVGTWRCLAVVRTGFEADIYRSLFQQMFVCRLHLSEGVHLGMAFSAAHVVSLTDNPAAAHYHGTHHRVWLGVLHPVLCQLQTAHHISFVCGHNPESLVPTV